MLGVPAVPLMGGGNRFVDRHGGPSHLQDVLLVECNPGKAIPKRITDLIPNGSDHFHHLKVFSNRAKTFEDFQAIVHNFCVVMEIGDSITAIEEGHSMSEVILNTLYSPIGMFFDSTWYPKHLKQRFLKGK